MYKHILVPLDTTATDTTALALARLLAGATGAALTALRIVSPALPGDASAVVGLAADKSIARRVHPVRHQADIGPAIVEEARTHHADLIVMATHARDGLARVARASVAEEVVARSSIPVALCGPRAAVDPATLRRPILVPLDGTPASETILEPAVQLGRALGAELYIHRVVVPAVDAAYCTLLGTFTEGELPESAYDFAAFDDAQRYVERQVARLRARGVAACGEAAFGPVRESIIETTELVRAGLIALSTHALRGEARAIIGSVTDSLLRRASCPLLLVRGVAGEPLVQAQMAVPGPAVREETQQSRPGA